MLTTNDRSVEEPEVEAEVEADDLEEVSDAAIAFAFLRHYGMEEAAEELEARMMEDLN